MTPDIEFKSFYDSVKDPSWPDIKDYATFTNLPKTIKNECFRFHGLTDRINEICDAAFWSNELLHVCVHENLAFVPVPKCAYTYYTTRFTDLGWKKVPIKDVDPDRTHFFGILKHPLERHLKGITELVVCSHTRSDPALDVKNPWIHQYDIDWESIKSSMSSRYYINLLGEIAVGDDHSVPYHVMFGDRLDKINWIPMDLFTDAEIKIKIMDICKNHGQDLYLPLDEPRMHESSTEKLEIYQTIKNQLLRSKTHLYRLYQLYGPDLKFYYQLLEKFSTN